MKIILVHSYKGGSGKTLVSCNLADIFAKMGHKTLLIEADFAMPSFHTIYMENDPDVFLNDYLYQYQHDLSHYIYSSKDPKLGIIYCSSHFTASKNILGADQSWYLDKIDQLETDLKKLDYDYLIIDSAPGFNLFLVNTLVFAQEIVLITRPDYSSFQGVLFLLQEIYSKIAFKSDVQFYVVFNQVPEFEKMADLVTSWKKEIRIKYKFVNTLPDIIFDAESSYLNAIQQIHLPQNNKVRDAITNLSRNFIEK